MLIKTSELIGEPLNYAVSIAEGYQPVFTDNSLRPIFRKNEAVLPTWHDYSTDWAHGGPLLEKYRIRIDCPWNPGPFEATCKIDGTTAWVKGRTVLIAATRCLVYAELGEEVEIPDELLNV